VLAALVVLVVCAGCSLINYDTNQARQAVGLGQVGYSDNLSACARQHNVAMSVFGYGHSTAAELFGCVAGFSNCAENIGVWRNGDAPLEVRADQQNWFNAWWASPEHRANILHPSALAEGDDIYVAWNGDVFATMELCW
jgi:uncharacterized protein YkwD